MYDEPDSVRARRLILRQLREEGTGVELVESLTHA